MRTVFQFLIILVVIIIVIGVLVFAIVAGSKMYNTAMVKQYYENSLSEVEFERLEKIRSELLYKTNKGDLAQITNRVAVCVYVNELLVEFRQSNGRVISIKQGDRDDIWNSGITKIFRPNDVGFDAMEQIYEENVATSPQ